MSAPLQEFDLIARFAAAARPHAAVELGIGDDAAILRPTTADGRLLVTTDLLAEGTHFLIPPATPREIGRKLLAVNLSDIAAMVGRPEAAFVSLLVSRSRGSACALELMDGLAELAREFNVAIAGGDTNVWDGPLVASLTLTGVAGCAGPVLRSGARPGDWLFVTGPLGGSLHGRHLQFRPRIREALALAETVELRAMIDLSDGLSRDVRHLTTEHGLGALMFGDRVPIHDDVDRSLPAGDRLRHALDDGEDFELLFAVSPDDGCRLRERLPAGVDAIHVGECTATPGECRLRTLAGEVVDLPPGGFEHRF